MIIIIIKHYYTLILLFRSDQFSLIVSVAKGEMEFKLALPQNLNMLEVCLIIKLW